MAGMHEGTAGKGRLLLMSLVMGAFLQFIVDHHECLSNVSSCLMLTLLVRGDLHPGVEKSECLHMFWSDQRWTRCRAWAEMCTRGCIGKAGKGCLLLYLQIRGGWGWQILCN